MKIFIVGAAAAEADKDQGLTGHISFQEACRLIGMDVAREGHTLVICSPFDDSADFYALDGAASSQNSRDMRIEFHFVDSEEVRTRLDAIIAQFGFQNVSRVPHPPARNEEGNGRKYSWLFCQLSALESCDAVIALGGNADGAANMLLLLAEAKRKPVLPLPFFGGAAKQSFARCRYELEDKLNSYFSTLQTAESAGSACRYAVQMAEKKRASTTLVNKPPSFFISYARARQAEADHVETLLRRRNLPVFRDESDFGAGHAIPRAITEAIHNANIFVALWSAEYACSPWCFDELELALDRHAEGTMELWILRVDKTRVVPVRARPLLSYDTTSREAIEGKILELLERELTAGKASAVNSSQHRL